ncbi:MAG: hypothetical protein PUP92_38470 [Rhizonema sp. PD38]|nr:hypothetical protein [Rhizonema sp. PD38]
MASFRIPLSNLLSIVGKLLPSKSSGIAIYRCENQLCAIAIMRTLAYRGDNRQFHLDWCAPHPEDFVFQQELEQLIAQNPHLTLKLRATKTDGRISVQEVQSEYPWTEGAVAFMCGPEA